MSAATAALWLATALVSPAAHAGAGWGAAATGGCEVGLLEEAGRCCWPGQGSDGAACIGPPTCPAGAEPTADGDCGPAACAAGTERAVDGQHCCWPGQGWSNHAAQCVGDAACPAGFVDWDGGCKSEAEATRQRRRAQGNTIKTIRMEREDDDIELEAQIEVGGCGLYVYFMEEHKRTADYCRRHPDAYRFWQAIARVRVRDIEHINPQATTRSDEFIRTLGQATYSLSGAGGHGGPGRVFARRCRDRDVELDEIIQYSLPGSVFVPAILREEVRCDLDADGKRESAPFATCLEAIQKQCAAAGVR